jgi:hypothetical protein
VLSCSSSVPSCLLFSVAQRPPDSLLPSLAVCSYLSKCAGLTFLNMSACDLRDNELACFLPVRVCALGSWATPVSGLCMIPVWPASAFCCWRRLRAACALLT